MNPRRAFRLSLESRLRVSLCLLFGAVTAWIVWEPVALWRGIARLQTLGAEVRQLSALLSSVQDEGTWATAVAASGATRYAAELRAAAVETDRELGRAKAFFDASDLAPCDTATRAPASAASAEEPSAAPRAGPAAAEADPIARLQLRLKNQRQLVEKRLQSSLETALVYRDFGDLLLRRLERSASDCPDVAVARRLARWLDALRLEQVFSAERANTAAVLTDDEFGPDSLRRHWQILAAEEALLKRLARGEQGSTKPRLFTETDGFGPAVTRVRAILADRQADGAFGVGPDEWTTASAEAARPLHHRSQVLLRAVDDAASQVQARAQRKVTVAVLVGAAELAAALAILHRYSRALRGALERANGHLGILASRLSTESRRNAGAGAAIGRGASEQAEALQRSVPTVQQLASNAAQNARHALAASDRCQASCSEVEGAVSGARELADTLQRLSSASERIGEISRTVEEIAFQTNLLALNASIEAARAGAAGAGFAVVAEEVRALARRSAEAAHHSGEIVQSSSTLSRGSVALAGQLRSRLEQTQQHVAEVEERLQQISRASEEQSQGADALQTAVLEIQAVAEANRGLAVELNESSGALLQLDGNLQETVAELGQLAERRAQVPSSQSRRPAPSRARETWAQMQAVTKG